MTFFSRGSRCRCVNDGPKRELRRKRGGERVVSFVFLQEESHVAAAVLAERLLLPRRRQELLLLRRRCRWSFQHHVHGLACRRERSSSGEGGSSRKTHCCVFLFLLALRRRSSSSSSKRERRLSFFFSLLRFRQRRCKVPRCLPHRRPRVPRELRGHGGELVEEHSTLTRRRKKRRLVVANDFGERPRRGSAPPWQRRLRPHEVQQPRREHLGGDCGRSHRQRRSCGVDDELFVVGGRLGEQARKEASQLCFCFFTRLADNHPGLLRAECGGDVRRGSEPRAAQGAAEAADGGGDARERGRPVLVFWFFEEGIFVSRLSEKKQERKGRKKKRKRKKLTAPRAPLPCGA